MSSTNGNGKGNLLISSLLEGDYPQYFQFDIKVNSVSILSGGQINFTIQPLENQTNTTYTLNFEVNLNLEMLE